MFGFSVGSNGASVNMPGMSMSVNAGVQRPGAPGMMPQQQMGMQMQPGMMQPCMAQPGMMQPGMQMQVGMQPAMAQPVMAQPVMAQPVAPGMMQPGMMQPGMPQPGMGAGVVNNGWQNFMNSFRAASFESDRTNTMQMYASSNPMITCQQLVELIKTCSFSSDRLNAVKFFGRRIMDAQNKPMVLSAFTFSSERTEAMKYM